MRKSSLIYLLVLAFIFARLYYLGPHVATDLHHLYPSNFTQLIKLPYTWGNEGAVGLGEYSTSVLWNWPVNFVFNVFGFLGIPFEILLLVFGFLAVLALGTYSVLKFLDYYKISHLAKLSAALFYLSNTYVLLLIDGGQLNIALAYALLPLAFIKFKLSVEGHLKAKTVSALCIFLMGVFDIRILYILALLTGFDLVASVARKVSCAKGYISSGFVAVLVLLLLNAYWVLPSIMARAPSLPQTYDRASQVDFLSFASLEHGLYFLQPHWWENDFGKVMPIRAEFVLIPLLTFGAVLISKKSTHVAFWFAIALIAIFLVKGSNPPLSGVYQFLFVTVPGFSLFRDPTKFFFLLAIAYLFLVATTLERLSQINKRLVYLGFILYILILSSPVWLGKMEGTFSYPKRVQDYKAVSQLMENDESFGRIVWIPTKPPLGYWSASHPSLEATRLASARPFAIGTIGRYETLNFLREHPLMGELASILGIKYFAYPTPQTKIKEEDAQYFKSFKAQLASKDWIVRRVYQEPVDFYELKNPKDHLFLASSPLIVIGSDRLYWELAEIDDYDLSSNPLVFAEEHWSTQLPSLDSTKVLLYKKQALDAQIFYSNSELVFPASLLDFDPNETGWWKRESSDLISWRDFLQQKYNIDNMDFDLGGGWAVAEGGRELSVQSPTFSSGEVLYARTMESSRGGEVAFYQAGELIGKINTKLDDPQKTTYTLSGNEEFPDRKFEYDEARVRWLEVGELIEMGPVTIKTSGEINVVNALGAIDRLPQLEDGNLIFWGELDDLQKKSLFISQNNAEIYYSRLNPTHYKVSISGLAKPATLVFGEFHDPLWSVNGQKSYKLYSLINGFTIEHDGEYDIYFTPQKYVLPGLMITAITASIIAGYFLYTFLNDRKNTRSS